MLAFVVSKMRRQVRGSRGRHGRHPVVVAVRQNSRICLCCRRCLLCALRAMLKSIARVALVLTCEVTALLLLLPKEAARTCCWTLDESAIASADACWLRLWFAWRMRELAAILVGPCCCCLRYRNAAIAMANLPDCARRSECADD